MYPTAILDHIVWGIQGASSFGTPARAWSESAASLLISSLWQGAIVACGLALCLRLAPRIPTRLRYAIWTAGFAAIVLLPFLPALIEFLNPVGSNSPATHQFGLAASGSASGSPSNPWLLLDARWSLGLAALWLTASLIRAVGLATHTVRMRRLWHSASPVAANGLDASFQSDAARRAAPPFQRPLAKGWNTISTPLGRIRISDALRAPTELCITSDLDRPCVIGFFRPRILIPDWLFNRLTPAELEQVVLHESEHLRRMDDWTNLLQKLCLVVFPLNPALWWLERRLCAEREMACDDAVVRRTQAPRAYAACLAGLAERGLERRHAALSLGAWQHRPELATRVHRLLRRPAVMNPAASAVSMVLVGCGLVAGTFTLARSPRLVAFVAPANQASNGPTASTRSIQPSPQGDARTDFVQGSIAFANSSTQPYRVVKTLAILPATRTTSPLRNSNSTLALTSRNLENQTQQTDDSSHPNRSLAAIIPTAIAAGMRARQYTASVAQQASQAAALCPIPTSANQSSPAQTDSAHTGWIVFTAYEEVQTTSSDEAAHGDADAPQPKAAAANTDPKTSASISVTRLELLFVQPASNPQADSNGQPAPNSPQRIAIPYRDGWFVIQL
jgi:hypothetical protein